MGEQDRANRRMLHERDSRWLRLTEDVDTSAWLRDMAAQGMSLTLTPAMLERVAEFLEDLYQERRKLRADRLRLNFLDSDLVRGAGLDVFAGLGVRETIDRAYFDHYEVALADDLDSYAPAMAPIAGISFEESRPRQAPPDDEQPAAQDADPGPGDGPDARKPDPN